MVIVKMEKNLASNSISVKKKRRQHMIDLSTKYMGLNLRNPIIVGSSGLADSVNKIQKIEQFGAGAVVLKSIFEEEIAYEYEDIIKDVSGSKGVDLDQFDNLREV
jgi:dihydroorotate dehydrogenase (fumarate)